MYQVINTLTHMVTLHTTLKQALRKADKIDTAYVKVIAVIKSI